MLTLSLITLPLVAVALLAAVWRCAVLTGQLKQTTSELIDVTGRAARAGAQIVREQEARQRSDEVACDLRLELADLRAERDRNVLAGRAGHLVHVITVDDRTVRGMLAEEYPGHLVLAHARMLNGDGSEVLMSDSGQATIIARDRIAFLVDVAAGEASAV